VPGDRQSVRDTAVDFARGFQITGNHRSDEKFEQRELGCQEDFEHELRTTTEYVIAENEIGLSSEMFVLHLMNFWYCCKPRTVLRS
jgi:hypothetical protein